MIEYIFFVIWREHEEIKNKILELIKENKNLEYVGEKKMKGLSFEEKINKLSVVYSTKFSPKDDRVINNLPISVLIVKDFKSKYELKKTNGTKTIKLLNSVSFAIKENIRNQYPSGYYYIHSSDDIEEANLICEAFDLDQFYINIKMMNIEDIYSKIYDGEKWNTCNVENTPHFKCINGSEKEYLDYINNIYSVDRKLSTLYNLDKEMTIESYNCSNDLLIRGFVEDDKVILRDGIHRCSCLKKKLDNFIKNKKYLKKLYGKYRSIDIKFKVRIIEKKYALKNLDYLKNHGAICDDIFKRNEDVSYVIMRGFDYLPDKPNPDLDIIFESENDYNKFMFNIKDLFLENKVINKGKITKFECKPNKETKYKIHQILTNAPKCADLPNKVFVINCYTKIPYDITTDLNKFIFANRRKVNNYYLPSFEIEYLMFRFSSKFDLKGKWKSEYSKRDIIIRNEMSKGEIDKIWNLLKSLNYEVIKYEEFICDVKL